MLSFSASAAVAQSASLQAGARSMGMGNLSACISDVWSMTNNIAGLADVKHATASASYHAIPSFRHFNRMAVVFAAPTVAGTAGGSVFRFGDDLYNEHVVSLGYANRFGLAALGVKGNYIQYRAHGLESRQAITISFGGLAALTPQVLFGAYIVNINQPTINPATDEKVQTQLLAGIAFKPSEKLIACTEIGKDVQHAPVIKIGIEYQVFRKMSFRTGFNFRPQAGFAGFGAKVYRFDLDYAMKLDNIFGLSHQATVVWHFKQALK